MKLPMRQPITAWEIHYKQNVPSIIGLHVSLHRRKNSSNTHAYMPLFPLPSLALYIPLLQLLSLYSIEHNIITIYIYRAYIYIEHIYYNPEQHRKCSASQQYVPPVSTVLPSTEFYITIQRFINNFSNLAQKQVRILVRTCFRARQRLLCFLSFKHFATLVKKFS